MRSRRELLVGLGTAGIAGVAGCSALPFGGGDTDGNEEVSLSVDAVGSPAWPESPFPVGIPPTLADRHAERARELLAAVPADPSVPNGAIAGALQSDREHAVDRLEADVDEHWPTERLSRWRSRRHAAATVLGTYRAATGEDDAATVTERRQTVREELGSLVADREYRASSPLEAALAHAPIEELVADCRRRVRPTPAYPADPVASPFRAGDAVGRVELAEATVADARRLREVYLTERSGTPSQWAPLIDAADRLGFAAARTRSAVQGFLDVDEPPFDADLEGTPGRSLFMIASGQVEAAAENRGERQSDGDVATAVIEAGQALAVVEALRAAIRGIRDGAYQDPVTAESVGRTADRAREAIDAADGSEDRRLAAHLVRPALGVLEFVSERIADGYADAARVQGELAWAELYARAVPAATAFALRRLE